MHHYRIIIYLMIFTYTIFFFCLHWISLTFACTTLICGKKATADGSVMASHSADGGGTLDPRLVKVPARDFPADAMRPIYASPENYPRYVGTERMVEEYYSQNCQTVPQKCEDFKPIGYIPQVSHTFAYFEATYGVMNENQVGIGESTCSGVFVANSVAAGGMALLSIDQLSQIAMERATTSREAVSLMGSLAEQYGFYGESDSFEGGAESLMVTDPNEGWIFHVLPDPSAKSAIWIAQRVPDDSFAVVANMFVIRNVNLTDSANFLGKSDMWEIAESSGLWKGGEPQDFTATFSDGEYSHKYYSGRRMWGAFRLVDDNLGLSADYDDLKFDAPYPVSIRVPQDKLLQPSDFFAIHRDWYEGTPYNPAADGVLAGGAFQTPDRYGGGAGEAEVGGAWERTISLYRTSASYVVQSRSWLPNYVGGVVWFGSYAAHGTCYVPLMVGAMIDSPACLSHVYQGVYDMSTSFWAYRAVLNLAQIKFSYIIQDVQSVQLSLEETSRELVNTISLKYGTTEVLSDDIRQDIHNSLFNNAVSVRDAFLDLFNSLMFKYADGWINTWTSAGFSSKNTGYPAWWLESVGYQNGPQPLRTSTPVTPVASSSSYADTNGKSGATSTSECLKACLHRFEIEPNDTSLRLCSGCCAGSSGGAAC